MGILIGMSEAIGLALLTGVMSGDLVIGNIPIVARYGFRVPGGDGTN
jgi:hypothetical protein